MGTDRHAWGFADRPIWRASALLAAAFFIFDDAWAEAGSRPGETKAIASDGIPAPIPRQAKTETSLRGNPLWAVPLDALAQTRARPIFSPSRRPPSPPVVASVPPPPPKSPPPREPERLKLTLLGTVIGTFESIGVFLDETSKEVIRIKAGASHDGWTLRSMHRRSARFEKNRQEATLMLAPPGSDQPASGADGVASRSRDVKASEYRSQPNAAENRARPVALTLPAPAPATPGTPRGRHEIRQDILSIGVQN